MPAELLLRQHVQHITVDPVDDDRQQRWSSSSRAAPIGATRRSGGYAGHRQGRASRAHGWTPMARFTCDAG